MPRWVNAHQLVVVAVGVPVAACLRRVAAKEAPYAGVIVPVAKQQQPGGRVRLVAAGARKLHRGRRAAAARERLAKRIVKQCVGRGAGAARYATGAAQRIRCEVGAAARAVLAHAWRVGTVAVLQQRTACRGPRVQLTGKRTTAALPHALGRC